MKYLASLIVFLCATSLYSMDTEKLDHQRTFQERALRVERINTYFKEIIENEDTLNSYKKVSKELEYAKKIANISLTYLDIFKKDLNDIGITLLPIQDDFKSLFYSNDSRVKTFKEKLQILRQHIYDEISTLASEGCTSKAISVISPREGTNFVTVNVQCLDFTYLYLEDFQSVANGYPGIGQSIEQLNKIGEQINALRSANSGRIKMIDSYLTWNNSQIETLKANRKEKIRLMHTNLDWFDVD